MFSCGNNVNEDRYAIFKLAESVEHFLQGYEYRLNLYGGESFLDIPLIEEYINRLINKNCISFSIPTNGYFMCNNELLEEIDKLFVGKTDTREKSKITISTSEYHQSQWNPKIKSVIEDTSSIEQYINLYKLLEVQNTFTTQRIIPHGRAKDDKLNCINPIIRCDLFENSEDLEIAIDPNGDIGFCEFGYKIGNVKDTSISELLNIKFNSVNKNKRVMLHRLNSVCKKCESGKYVCVKK